MTEPKPPARAPERMSGAQSLVRSLQRAGAEVVFGIPGGAILPAYDPLFDADGLRHILVRHEQGAGHAATGYAQGDRPGRRLHRDLGSGRHQPGHADRRRVHGLGADRGHHRPGRPRDDRHRRLPGGRHLRHHDADHQAQLPGAGRRRHSAGDRRGVPHRGDRTARPVLVDIPKDVLVEETDFVWPTQLDLPGYRPTTKPHGKQVREAAKLIVAAERPVLYVGGGVLKAHAAAELRLLADLTGIPVVTTLMARGAFPDSHSHNLGMPGMHGNVTAVTAMQKSDLLVALGAPVRRPRDRQPRQLRARREDRPRRHRPGRDRQEPHRRRPDRGRRQGGHRRARRRRPGRVRRRAPRRPRTLVAAARPVAHDVPAGLRPCPRTARSRRSTSSPGSARSPAPTRSMSRASASTRCGPRSS